MSNLKENLLKKCNEMITIYVNQIENCNEQLGKIPSGRNKQWENNLLRATTLNQFWGSLKQSLELGSYER